MKMVCPECGLIVKASPPSGKCPRCGADMVASRKIRLKRHKGRRK